MKNAKELKKLCQQLNCLTMSRKDLYQKVYIHDAKIYSDSKDRVHQFASCIIFDSEKKSQSLPAIFIPSNTPAILDGHEKRVETRIISRLVYWPNGCQILAVRPMQRGLIIAHAYF